MIKMGIEETWPDSKIKLFLKKTDDANFTIIKNNILSNPGDLDDSALAGDIMDAEIPNLN
jgi:hypothetical protein